MKLTSISCEDEQLFAAHIRLFDVVSLIAKTQSCHPDIILISEPKVTNYKKSFTRDYRVYLPVY